MELAEIAFGSSEQERAGAWTLLRMRIEHLLALAEIGLAAPQTSRMMN